MKIEWQRGFFRAWTALALAWVGFVGWNEYRMWDSYFISLSRGFPSFPQDYAQFDECVKPFPIQLSTVWPDGKPFAGWKGDHEAASFPGIHLPPQFRDAWGRAHVIVGSLGSENYLELVGRLPCVTCPAYISKYDPYAEFSSFVPSPEAMAEEEAKVAHLDKHLDQESLKHNSAWTEDSTELKTLWRAVIVGSEVAGCWQYAPAWQRLAFEISENWPLVKDSASRVLVPPFALLIAGYILGWIVRGFQAKTALL
jgi:hypothetical protein